MSGFGSRVGVSISDKSEVDVENGTSEARPRLADMSIKSILSRGSPRRFQVDVLLKELVLVVLLNGGLVALRVRFSSSDKGTNGHEAGVGVGIRNGGI